MSTSERMPIWPGNAFFDDDVQKVLDKYSGHFDCKFESPDDWTEIDRLENLALPITMFLDINNFSENAYHQGNCLDFGWHYSRYNEFSAELLLVLTCYHNRPKEQIKQRDAMVKIVLECKDKRTDPEWIADLMRNPDNNIPEKILRGEKWVTIAAYIWDIYRIKVKEVTLKNRLWPYEVERRNKILNKYEKHIQAWKKLSSKK